MESIKLDPSLDEVGNVDRMIKKRVVWSHYRRWVRRWLEEAITRLSRVGSPCWLMHKVRT